MTPARGLRFNDFVNEKRSGAIIGMRRQRCHRLLYATRLKLLNNC